LKISINKNHLNYLPNKVDDFHQIIKRINNLIHYRRYKKKVEKFSHIVKQCGNQFEDKEVLWRVSAFNNR
jgi:hypothetical protein